MNLILGASDLLLGVLQFPRQEKKATFYIVATATPVGAAPLLTKKFTALAFHSRNEPYSSVN